MARRKLIWEIGLADQARPVISRGLAAHGDTLAARGALVVADRDESRLATIELLRTHKAEGLRRKEVEGRWSAIADRAWRHRGVSLLSTPDLGTADKDQLRLALDAVIGLEVHLVVSVSRPEEQRYGAWLADLRRGATLTWEVHQEQLGRPDDDHVAVGRECFRAGHDVEAMLERWGWTLRPERQHVLDAADPVQAWRGFLAIAGIDPDGLPAPTTTLPDPLDSDLLRRVNAHGALATSHRLLGHATSTEVPSVTSVAPEAQAARAAEVLHGVLAENERLRAQIDDVAAQLDKQRKKKRKLKRKLVELGG